jgi:hypothetical protein
MSTSPRETFHRPPVGVSPPAFDELPLAAALLDGTRAGFGPIDDCLVCCACALHLARSPGAFSALRRPCRP